MRQRWVVAIVACGSLAACKRDRNKLDRDYAAYSNPKAARDGGPDAPHAVIVEGVSGTGFFAPDARSFWVQDDGGGALVHLGLDGARLGELALDGPLAEAALWISTSMARRPVSPDGHRILETRSESEGGHSAVVIDL
jgi:hypothetical protein